MCLRRQCRLARLLINFFVDSFPITGEIIEILKIKKSQNEAKKVKRNIGQADGVLEEFEFSVGLGYDERGDLAVKEAIENFSICKVFRQDKKIMQLLTRDKQLFCKNYL